MTRSEYTQHADPAVRRRAAMRLIASRQIQLPAGVDALHAAEGEFNGEDVVMVFTTDGLYAVRAKIAEKVPDYGLHVPPLHRSTDRDYRPLWIALVGVATALALWWTL